MTSAKILKNEDLLSLLWFELQETKKEFEKTMFRLARAHDVMILVVICEGLVTFRYVPCNEVKTPYDLANNSKAIVAEKWGEFFISHVDSGDGAWKGPVSETYADDHDFTASVKNSKRHFKRFFEVIFPHVTGEGISSVDQS